MNARCNKPNRNRPTLAMAGCLTSLAASTARARTLRPPCHHELMLAANAADCVLIKMPRSERVAPSAASCMTEPFVIAKLARSQAWSRQVGSRSVLVAVADAGV